MEDGALLPNTMLETFPDTVDFDLMDDLLFDGYWLETTEGSKLWQSGASTSGTINLSSYCLPATSETNTDHLNPYPHEKSRQEGLERSEFGNYPPPVYAQIDELVGRQTQNQAAASSGKLENFLVESTETSRRFWIPPSEVPSPVSSVKKRLIQAIELLRESASERDILIQIWVPINRGGKHVLTTNDQPYSLSPHNKNLADYRDVSRSYQFAAEENSKEFLGLPGRVFLKKLPEWTPDVRFFKRDEYPRVNYAHQCNVSGSLGLPVFERGSGTCLGVVEIVTTTQKVKYRPELEYICKALEAVDLRGSEISSPPSEKACDDSYQASLTDIQEVLKSLCDTHGLPLALTWAPCIRQGKSGCRHSNENYARCVSTIDSSCYVRNPKVLGFHEACSEHHLFRGEGVVGRAFSTNKSYFAADITAFSKFDYPLSHYAKLFELRAAVAIRLRSIYSGSEDFVLEFFLPSECCDPEERRRIVSSLSSGVQQVCWSLCVVTDRELVEEMGFPGKVNGSPSGRKLDEEDNQRLESSVSKECSQEESTKISNVIEAQPKKKEAYVLLDPGEEFKDMTHWDNGRRELYHGDVFLENKRNLDSGRCAESGGHSFSVGRNFPSGLRKAAGKRRTKTEKSISLQVLRSYFSGSLKDAASSLEVCPTTLKRICRQHGISRWPSRKIKKVGHSLKKLQRIIDSVQGVEGSIPLSSFYSKFPDLSSPNLPRTTPVSTSKVNGQLKQLKTQTEGSSLISPVTTSLTKSPTSSCSHSSSSSFCCFTETKQPSVTVHVLGGDGDASLEKKPSGVLERARNDREVHCYGPEETKLLLKTHRHEFFSEPPLPKGSNQVLRDGDSGLRVKATFGERKIRFSVQQNWGFRDLQQQIVSRFSIDDENDKINLKYLDDDSEWVLLTCDADLEECIDLHRSSRSNTIKLSVHQSLSSNLGSIW